MKVVEETEEGEGQAGDQEEDVSQEDEDCDCGAAERRRPCGLLTEDDGRQRQLVQRGRRRLLGGRCRLCTQWTLDQLLENLLLEDDGCPLRAGDGDVERHTLFSPRLGRNGLVSRTNELRRRCTEGGGGPNRLRDCGGERCVQRRPRTITGVIAVGGPLHGNSGDAGCRLVSGGSFLTTFPQRSDEKLGTAGWPWRRWRRGPVACSGSRKDCRHLKVLQLSGSMGIGTETRDPPR